MKMKINHYLSFLLSFFYRLISLVPLQRYTKALSLMQKASLIEKSIRKHWDKVQVITDVCGSANYFCSFYLSLRFLFYLETLQAIRNYCYDDNALLIACGVSIEKQPTQVDGLVLEAPKVLIDQFFDGYLGRFFYIPHFIGFLLGWQIYNFQGLTICYILYQYTG